MRSFALLASTATVLGLVSARPSPQPRGAICMTEDQSKEIVDQLTGKIMANFDADTAKNLLSSSFSYTSDSASFINGRPYPAITYAKADDFISAQGAPLANSVDVINIDVVSCYGTIAFRWRAHVGSEDLPVTGMSIVNTTMSGNDNTKIGPDGYQVASIASEFNAGAWTLDLDGTCYPPSAPAGSHNKN